MFNLFIPTRTDVMLPYKEYTTSIFVGGVIRLPLYSNIRVSRLCRLRGLLILLAKSIPYKFGRPLVDRICFLEKVAFATFSTRCRVLRNTCLHLENCIYSVTGTISRTAERKTGQRNDGAYRSDSRIPLNLQWQVGAQKCCTRIMRLLLRPPTD